MTVQAQSADGTIHEFPDGTNPAVIDRVMHGYATQGRPTLGGVAGQFGRGLVNGIAGSNDTVGRLLLGDLPGQAVSAAQTAAANLIPGVNAARHWLADAPRNTAERIANTVGQYAPGLAFGPEADAGAVAQLATRVGRNVIAPAASSLAARYGAQSFGATPQQQETAANVGGLAGGVGANMRITAKPGADLSPALGAPSLASPGQVSRALKYVARSTQTPNPAMVAAREAGKPVPLFAMGGDEGVKAMKVLTAKPGATSGALRKMAGDLGNPDPDAHGILHGFNDRARLDLLNATGLDSSAVGGDMQALSDSLRKQAGGVNDLYDAATLNPDGTPKPVNMTPHLANVLQEPEVNAVVQKAIRRIGKNATAPGIQVDPDTGAPVMDSNTRQPIIEQQPTAPTLNLAKKWLGKSIARYPDGRVITSGPEGVGNDILQGHLSNFTTALAGDEAAGVPAAIPGYRDALDKAGDVLSMERAYKRGQTTMLSSQAPHAAYESEFSALSPSDQAAWKAGAANAMEDGMQKGRLGPRSFKDEIVQNKMGTTFGPDATGQFLANMGQEYGLKDALNQGQAMRGSQTGSIAEGSKAMDAPQGFVQRMLSHAPPLLVSTMVGGPHGAAGYTVGQLGKAASGWQPFAMSQGARDVAGQLLMSPTLTGSDVQGLLSQSKPGLSLSLVPPTLPGLLPTPNSVAYPGT